MPTKDSLHRVEKWSILLLAFALSWSIFASNVLLSLCALLAIRKIIIDPAIRRDSMKGVTIPLLVFVSVEFLSMLLSGFPVRFHSFLEDKWVLVAYFSAIILIRDIDRFKEVLVSFLAGGAMVSVLATIQFFFGWDVLHHKTFVPIHGNRFMAVGSFNNHLTFGGVALIIFWEAFGLFLYSLRYKFKVRYFLLAVLPGFALIVSYARSALVGLSAGVMVVFLSMKGKWKLWFALCCVLAAVFVMIVIPGMPERFARALSADQTNEGTRIRLWLTSFVIIRHYPLFGMGQNNFDLGFDKFHIPGFYYNHAHPHNDFLSVGVDGGLLALGAFIIMWIIFFRQYGLAWKTYDKHDRLESWMLVGAMAAVGSVLLGGMFQNFQTDAEVGTMLWFVIGMTHWIQVQSKEQIE